MTKDVMTTEKEVERRVRAPRWADWLDWMESELQLPALRSFGFEKSMRCEEFEEEGRYVVRAELPGVDPDKDISVTVEDGVLTISAERTHTVKEKHRTEFSYGTMVRSLSLPKGVDADAVTADYADGILTVSVPLPPKPVEARTTVPITRT